MTTLLRKKWIKMTWVKDQFGFCISMDFSEKRLWIGFGFIVIVIGTYNG